MSFWYIIILSIASIHNTISEKVNLFSHDENVAKNLIDLLDEEYSFIKHQEAIFTYYYNVDVNDENQEQMIAAIVDSNRFLKCARQRLSAFEWKGFQNQTLRRLFNKLTNIGNAILDEDKFLSYMAVLLNLKKRYLETTVCHYRDCNKCSVKLPEILSIFATSRNPSELLHYWVAWRNATGRSLSKKLHQVFEINNDIAVSLDFPNAADMWIAEYAAGNLEKNIMKLWSEIKPLYDQLHAYVRRKLRILYGNRLFSEAGTIPAHLLGNMWAQKWNVYNLAIPFPLNHFPNVTTLLFQKNYTVKRMIEVAEEFFEALSFTKLNGKFWEKSILEHPKNRKMSCQVSAWDLFTGKDYRIKMCLKVTEADFVTLHHNLAHVHYFMAYKHQPIAFRDEPNPGFHEAMANIFTLTVLNPRYLKKLGLLKNYSDDDNMTINYLFQLALQKIAVLPYAIVLDLYRWNFFRGNYDPDKYNCEWWKLRKEYQGISPPVERTKVDYDPASIFHMSANKPFIRYVMSFGSSEPWQRIMKIATGESKLSSQPLLEFFQPLMEYLKTTNEKNKEHVGWKQTNKVCQASSVFP